MMKTTFACLICATTVLFAGCAKTRPAQKAAAPAPAPARPALVGTRVNAIVIRSARWGYEPYSVDVTARVVNLLREQQGFVAKAESLLDDAHESRSKGLAVLYEYAGRQHVFVAPNGEKVTYDQLLANAQRQ